MKTKSRLFLASAIVVMAIALNVVAKADGGGEMYCTSSSCPGEARCTGDFDIQSGCRITCYVWYGGTLYVPNGSADCEASEF